MSSLRNGPQPLLRSFLPGLLAAASAFALAVALTPHIFFLENDADQYLELAAGGPGMQPFASRPLAPLLVRLLSHLLHRPVQDAFVVFGLLSLALLLFVVFRLLTDLKAPAWFLLACVTLPLWPQLYENLTLPDLWCAALLALFFVLLHRGWSLVAASLFLPLMLSRESTVLLLLCFLVVAVRRRITPAVPAVALGASIAGSLIVRLIAAHARTNRENLPQFLYLLAKIPWNTLRNLGIVPWSNRYAMNCTVPQTQVALHLGSVTAVGLCGFYPSAWIFLLYGMLDVFGILPLLLLFLWRRGLRLPENLSLHLALVYGVFSFLIAPTLGTSIDRLSGYGWPAFLLATPALLAAAPQLHRVHRRWTPLLLALHLTTCFAAPHLSFIPATALLVACNLGAWRVLQLLWRDNLRIQRDRPPEQLAEPVPRPTPQPLVSENNTRAGTLDQGNRAAGCILAQHPLSETL